MQNAVSHHNMSYWMGRQYLGVGPGELSLQINATIHACDICEQGTQNIPSVTGAHGRFVPLGEGRDVREARTQTLAPDVWIQEVQQRGHGTRRRIPLSHLGL